MSNLAHSPPSRERQLSLRDAIARGDPLATAMAYRELGLSTFPIKTDGSKEPAVTGWRRYAERLAEPAELRAWHGGSARYGLGIAGGPASGNLAVLDFERWDAFQRRGQRLLPEERAALARAPVIGTPRGGAHVYCRLPEPVRGMKLARSGNGVTVIEVRGCQHYVAAPGSPAACHSTRRVWRVIRDGWLDGGPFEPMAIEVYHALTVHAAELNEYIRPAAREVVGDRGRGERLGERPGDQFNQRVRLE